MEGKIAVLEADPSRRAAETWAQFTSQAPVDHCYPTEWVVRALLGTYPHKPAIPLPTNGEKLAVDVGCGDGRNLSLLRNAGYRVLGIDTHVDILRRARDRGANRDSPRPTMFVGTSSHLPVRTALADLVLCSSSLYYCDEDMSFTANLAEQCRILKEGGYLLANFPDRGHFLYADGQDLRDGSYVRIGRDPHGIRDGTVHRVFDSRDELSATLSAFFAHVSIGHLSENYFGYQISMWVAVAQKAAQS